MLSYQHIYHAGNLADVHKHFILCELLNLLTGKDRPISYMETHAGRGLYNLRSPESEKTGEAEQGIIALRKKKILPENSLYIKILDDVEKKEGKDFYPGSPLVAKLILRKKDQIHLMEKHPQEIKFLRRNLEGENVSVHFRDGYEGVLALSPPKPPEPRRGLVFIDPSYEVKTEYSDVANFVSKLSKKWPEATIVIWYPILKQGYHKDLIQDIKKQKFENVIVDEYVFSKNKNDEGMLGSGMAIINAPFGIDSAIKNIRRILI